MPWWPPQTEPPLGAPNILVVLFDDVGFSDFGCYGSPIKTPTIDRLAAQGLRYTGFHTTAMCSTTRAALLTGRNHHSAKAMRDDEMLAEIEDFLEGGTRTNSQRVATWSSQTGWSGDNWLKAEWLQ
jgi:arylsulfatase A-like enzyme